MRISRGLKPPVFARRSLAASAQVHHSHHLTVFTNHTAECTLGFRDLFGPLRPTVKAAEPHTPMADYVARTRPDGLPADPRSQNVEADHAVYVEPNVWMHHRLRPPPDPRRT